MKLEFLQSAYECYRSIKETEPETAGRIKSYLIDALSHPMSGMGDPTALEGKYKGLWKRSLSICDSIYYSFNSEVVTVVALSFGQSDDAHPITGVNISQYSPEEYDSVMALMAANRGMDEEPKVGLFWYNASRNELFGIISRKLSDYSEANASDGRITCSELHEDIWKREYRRQKYRGGNHGPYVGAYQDKPRGRIFYNINTKMFEIAAGKWIEAYPQAIQLIIQEFNLPAEKTTVKYAIHWDIGMSWR